MPAVARVSDPSRAQCEEKYHVEARFVPREGDERLSEGRKSDSRRVAGNRESSETKRNAGRPGKAERARKHAAGDLGRALRSVYDRALREEVPPDFLDLLGRLD